jgi:hypothetical protein
MKKTSRPAVTRWLAIGCLAAVPLSAAAASGQFTFVVGEVSLAKANGQRVAPVRGTPVDPGDRIVTGTNGMAQLTMVDQARLSLRPSSQFVIEAYPEQRESQQGAILTLLKGTLRTFTGLLASSNRDKYVMKTRVATVGIRGSGNILYACDENECDESVAAEARGRGSITVNHTIEGSHSISNLISGAPAGTPPQQGGAQTLITGPGQTVLVMGSQVPRYIPTPRFIADAGTNMTGAGAVDAAAPGSAAGETRNFAPSDSQSLPPSQQVIAPFIGNNGLGFPTIDASGNLSADPLNLRDVILAAAGSPFLAQSLGSSVVLEGSALRSYEAYASAGGVQPVIVDGTLAESDTLTLNGALISLGRWSQAALGFYGPGTETPYPGSVHWVHSPSGYPTYLSDVLTGTATYTLASATSPTNQNNVVGSLGSMSIDVNFSDRTLDFSASVSMPAGSGGAGGQWQMSADNVAIALNSFFASTEDRLVITNGTGQSSQGTSSLAGSFEGSFVGTGIGAAVVGYGITDITSTNPSDWQFVNGVAALSGSAQDATAPFREGRISDANGVLTDFIRTFATTNRPDEVTSDAQGAATAFSAPSPTLGAHASYALGTAQVVESGVDVETGMIWGRWGGGTATVTRGSASEQLFLQSRSLHYIFAGSQSGPVALPLTGTAIYDVIGSTNPTDIAGHVGVLNSASLNANFTNRTVDAAVNIAIAGQTWNGSASGIPIYRDQYFSAFSGNPIPGLPNPAPLQITCTPNCGQNATGSLDGFFTGRTGQRAGMMYNLGGNQGAVALGRRGGS